MIAKGQSIQARLARLNVCCCPIHGLPMPQETGWYSISSGHITTVGCPRKDCAVMALTSDYNGPAILLPHLRHLLMEPDTVNFFEYFERNSPEEILARLFKMEEARFQEKLRRGMKASASVRGIDGEKDAW